MDDRISHMWDLINPQTGRYIMHHVEMKKTMPLEKILAVNLSALMSQKAGLDTIEKLSKRSGVGRGTVDRIKKAEVSTKLETLERLAEALSVEPVDLLTENPAWKTSGIHAIKASDDSRELVANSLSAACETAAEQRLLSAYRLADSGGRGALDGAANAIIAEIQGVFGDKR